MANTPDSGRTGDPLEAIARSLANLEALWREELQRREEDRRQMQKQFAEDREKNAALYADLAGQTKRIKGWKAIFSSDQFLGLVVLLMMLLLVVTVLILVAR